MMHTTMFPSLGTQILSSLIHFLGVTVLAHCVSRRVKVECLTSLQTLMQLSWARLLVILVFVDSWLFLFTSGIIIFGAGMELNQTVCSLGIYICIAFYASSKALIYAFLVEKVHVVWAPVTGSRKLRSPVYMFCIVTLALYISIVALLLIGRIAYFRPDGLCMIGLAKLASIPLLAYDLYVNALLTILFIWPLWQSNFISPIVRRVALRTLAASFIALTTSAINMLVLTLMHGEQLSWVCLGSCGTDVIVNAIVLFWVTSSSGRDDSRSGTTPTSETVGGPERAGRRAPPRPLSAKSGRPVLFDMGPLPPSPRVPSIVKLGADGGASSLRDSRDAVSGAGGLPSPPPSATKANFLSDGPSTYGTWDEEARRAQEEELPLGRRPSTRMPASAFSRFANGLRLPRTRREPRSVEITVTQEYDLEIDIEQSPSMHGDSAKDAAVDPSHDKGHPLS